MFGSNTDTAADEESGLPIVHVPHDTRHAGEPQPGGPGVVLVAALAGARAGDEKDSEGNVEADKDEHDEAHCAEVNPGDSARLCALKKAVCKEGEGRVV